VTSHWLALDLGAESGRGMLGIFDGERLVLRELGRFATNRGPEDLGPDGVRRWDFERIWREVEALLGLAEREAGGRLSGVGVDSWGVDYGLLDESGRLLALPVQYRDDSHAVAMKRVLEAIPRADIWSATGIQFMPFNTLYQLAAVQAREPETLRRASRLLMMPDLLHHRLTGGAARTVEATNASTTQLLDPMSGAWRTDLLDRIGVPHHFLGPIGTAGACLGETASGVPVYAPATHDTGSAVVAVPASGEVNWAFLSSGTWSLLGAERRSPLITDEALAHSFSNEGGVNGTTRFLTNIMGLWLVQECRRSLTRAGEERSYAELAALAAAAPEGGPVVDATAQRFLAPKDMAQEIRAACAETGQASPETTGALIRCCLESLALAYRRKLAGLERLQGAPFAALHLVGGGTQNAVLNQWTADACGLPVAAGPVEAAAAGNVLAQMVGAGALSGWQEARDLCRASFDVVSYTPTPSAARRWEDAYPRD
jgi:rhamnulokinase